MTRQNHNDVDNTGAAMRPVMEFDPARFADEVDLFDITEAQKHELLSTLWSIMRSFVELGFTVDVCTALLADAVAVPDEGKVR